MFEDKIAFQCPPSRREENQLRDTTDIIKTAVMIPIRNCFHVCTLNLEFGDGEKSPRKRVLPSSRLCKLDQRRLKTTSVEIAVLNPRGMILYPLQWSI